MTALLRLRGSLQEIGSRFGAVAKCKLEWRPWIWPGEMSLVIGRDDDGTRQLEMMPWGLPATSFKKPALPAQRGVIFGRDLQAGSGSRVAAPEAMQRCLIIIEACAYPIRTAGNRTRAWAGLWDEPLAAWGGVCTSDRNGCAGVLMPANSLLSRVSDTQPLLLNASDQKLWLAGAGPLALSLPYTEEHWYLEASDEAWGSGRFLD